MRLFTGLAIASPVIAKLDDMLERLRPLARVKWSPLKNLHITTKFIGQWPEPRLPELTRALEGNHGQEFSATVARFGYFPNPHHPHAFFAGIQGGLALVDLAQKPEAALEPLG